MGSGSYGDVFEVNYVDDSMKLQKMVAKKFDYHDIFKRHMHLEYFLEMIELLRNNPSPYLVKIIDRI